MMHRISKLLGILVAIAVLAPQAWSAGYGGKGKGIILDVNVGPNMHGQKSIGINQDIYLRNGTGLMLGGEATYRMPSANLDMLALFASYERVSSNHVTPSAVKYPSVIRTTNNEYTYTPSTMTVTKTEYTLGLKIFPNGFDDKLRFKLAYSYAAQSVTETRSFVSGQSSTAASVSDPEALSINQQLINNWREHGVVLGAGYLWRINSDFNWDNEVRGELPVFYEEKNDSSGARLMNYVLRADSKFFYAATETVDVGLGLTGIYRKAMFKGDSERGPNPGHRTHGVRNLRETNWTYMIPLQIRVRI